MDTRDVRVEQNELLLLLPRRLGEIMLLLTLSAGVKTHCVLPPAGANVNPLNDRLVS